MNTNLDRSLPTSDVSGERAKRKHRKTKGVDPLSSKQVIRDLGLKVTEQRILILDIIRAGTSHFTAQDAFEAVAKKNPGLGFATVYRFLRTLSENRFVTEIRMGGMPARYEWAGKQHHDHLTCVACGKIVEFENLEIERLQETVATLFGFELTGHILELYGKCPECRKLKP
jgi:Fur family transcriptional regulator, ferric uptake regulator